MCFPKRSQKTWNKFRNTNEIILQWLADFFVKGQLKFIHIFTDHVLWFHCDGLRTRSQPSALIAYLSSKTWQLDHIHYRGTKISWSYIRNSITYRHTNILKDWLFPKCHNYTSKIDNFTSRIFPFHLQGFTTSLPFSISRRWSHHPKIALLFPNCPPSNSKQYVIVIHS